MKDDMKELAGVMVVISFFRYAFIAIILTLGEPDLIDGIYNLLSSFQ